MLGPDGLKQNYSFHAGNETSEALLQSKYGDAFDKPVEKCLLLQNRQFGLAPALPDRLLAMRRRGSLGG